MPYIFVLALITDFFRAFLMLCLTFCALFPSPLVYNLCNLTPLYRSIVPLILSSCILGALTVACLKANRTG